MGSSAVVEGSGEVAPSEGVDPQGGAVGAQGNLPADQLLDPVVPSTERMQVLG